MVLEPILVTYTLPAISTAIPPGIFKPVPIVTVAPPPIGIFFTEPVPESDTYTLPAISTATPYGALKPDPNVIDAPPPTGIFLIALLL